MNRFEFAILAATMFISMLGFGFIVPLLPIYADTLGANSVQLGLIVASSSFSNLLCLPFMGPLSDRFGRKGFLLCGLLILGCAFLGLAWVKDIEHLILLRCIQGIAMSMHLPVAQAYLGDLTPVGEEGRWMGYLNAILFGGVGAGPFFGGMMNDLFGFQSVFLISALLLFLSFLLTLIFLKGGKQRQQRARRSVSLGLLWRNKTLRAVVILQMGSGMMTGVSMAFLPVLATVKLGLSTTLVGLILASRTPISMLQTVSGRFADTHNRKIQMTAGSLTSAIALVLITFCGSFWTLLASFTLLALGTVMLQPASSAYMLEEGRRSGMGAMMSMLLMSMQLGASLGPVAMGRVADAFGQPAAFHSAAAINGVALLAFLWMMRGNSGRKAQNPSTAPAP
jgi:MFS family permease